VKKYKNYKNEDLNYKYRRNEYVRADLVRLIDEEGEVIGEMSSKEALDIAKSKELDLVEVAPNSKPPVCKLIEWSKFKYEYSKKQKNSKPQTSLLKEIWFKPMMGEGDKEYRIKRIIEFLSKKNKVKITVRSGKDRRIGFDQYFDQIHKILVQLEGYATVETPPKLEGRRVYAIIRSKK
jgi:translation initiation factor IF-3